MAETTLALNNREIAAAVWLGLLSFWGLLHERVRSSLANAIRTAVQWKILASVGALAGWVGLEVWLGTNLGIWRLELTKDTIFWFVGSALVLLVNYITSDEERFDLLRRNIVGAFGVAAFLSFFLNLTVLSLPFELILQPIVGLLAATAVYARYQEDSRSAERVTQSLLVLIGLALLSYTVGDLYRSWEALNLELVVLRWLLPIWLTAGLVPLLYLAGVYADYDWAFAKINYDTDDRWTRLRAKVALFLELRLRLEDVRAFGYYWGREITSVDSFGEAREVAGRYLQDRREREQAEIEKQERLDGYAGSDEVDEEGRRLDRRGFEETQDALTWLHTCHMGHHDEDDGYRRDLLNLLEGSFTDRGLPQDHGVHMEVAQDGEAWYAWRRTVSGWCFAIGANDEPPNQWLYDGPEPPGGFPGGHPDWGDNWMDLGSAPNWM